MNRIQRIAAAAAISTAVIAPATGAVAYAGPIAPTQDQTEQLLRQEQQYMQEPVDEQLLRQEQGYMQEPVDEQLLRQEQGYMQEQQWPEPVDGPSASDATTGLRWETVGLAALGAGVLAAGGVVLVRRYHHEPRPA
jgi:hypothetical protein